MHDVRYGSRRLHDHAEDGEAPAGAHEDPALPSVVEADEAHLTFFVSYLSFVICVFLFLLACLLRFALAEHRDTDRHAEVTARLIMKAIRFVASAY